jgi:site-specific recombinase XerD
MTRSRTARHPAPRRAERPDAPEHAGVTSLLTPHDDAFLDALDRRFASFLDHARHVLNHSAATCAGYRTGYLNFRRFLVVGRNGRQVAVMTHAIDEWIAWNRKRGCSPVSVNTYWRSARVFFQFVERTDGTENPFRAKKMPPIPAPVPKARTQDECRRILAAASNYPWRTEFQRVRAVALFGVLIFAGLRRGEVTRLLYTDVDVDTGTIRIVRGKGRNGGKDRTAYMNDELQSLLRVYLRERARCGFTCPEFFASMTSRRGLSVHQFIRLFRLVRTASGIRFSIHSLRHSFVTMLLQSGVPIHIAKELAGHTDINTTAGYLRVWDDEQRAHIRRLKI